MFFIQIIAAILLTIGFGMLDAAFPLSAYYLNPAFAETDSGQYGDIEDDQTEYDNDGSSYDDQYPQNIEDDRYEPEDDYAADTSLIDDTAVTDENSYVILNILSNDREYFGQDTQLNLDFAYGASFGTVIANSDNTITYIPSRLGLQSGSTVFDMFYYTASYDDGSSHYGGSVNLTIHQVNDVPVVGDSEFTIANDDEFIFYLEAFDEDSDSLTFFIASFDGWGEYALDPDTGRVTYTPYANVTGEDVISFGASDGASTSGLATITITTKEGSELLDEQSVEGNENGDDTVDDDYYDEDYDSSEEEESTPEDDEENNEEAATSGSDPNVNATDTADNGEPVADAGGNLEVQQGEQVQLDGTGSYDPDGDELTYAWSQVSGPEITLSDSGSPTPTFLSLQANATATLEFELVVSDGLSTSQPSSVTVIVSDPDSEESTSSNCAEVIPVAGVSASGYEPNLEPTDAIDNNLNTRWSKAGIGSWIRLDLGNQMTICSVDIAWYKGDSRSSDFVIAVSDDGISYVDVYSGDSSGATSSAESYGFDNIEARYVRITVNGNTENNFASITEIEILKQSA